MLPRPEPQMLGTAFVTGETGKCMVGERIGRVQAQGLAEFIGLAAGVWPVLHTAWVIAGAAVAAKRASTPRMRQRGKKISRATVYRTLELLHEGIRIDRETVLLRDLPDLPTGLLAVHQARALHRLDAEDVGGHLSVAAAPDGGTLAKL